MKYIAVFSRRNNKYYARSINSGKTVTTERLMDEVAPADVAAVLRALSDAMRGHLCDGDKVRLDNIGTFYLTADASGNGVNTEEEVSSTQINRVNVRFAAQKKRVGGGSKTLVPTLASGDIRWERANASDEGTGSTGSGSTTPTNPGNGEDEG